MIIHAGSQVNRDREPSSIDMPLLPHAMRGGEGVGDEGAQPHHLMYVMRLGFLSGILGVADFLYPSTAEQ